jgi:hypothetical protein
MPVSSEGVVVREAGTVGCGLHGTAVCPASRAAKRRPSHPMQLGELWYVNRRGMAWVAGWVRFRQALQSHRAVRRA